MSEPRRSTHVALETTEPTSFGSGFTSGLLAAVLGIAGFGLALSLRFPQYFGYERLAPLHGLAYLRAAIHGTLIASFLLGTLSAFLRANKALALTGLGFTLAAALIGGSQVPVGAEGPGAWLGVDFFVLNLLVTNANATPADGTLTFLREGEAPVTSTVTVAARSRLTIDAGEGPHDGGATVEIESTQVCRRGSVSVLMSKCREPRLTRNRGDDLWVAKDIVRLAYRCASSSA